MTNEDRYLERGPRPEKDPVISFREYLQKVSNDVSRSAELKILISLFGLNNLELVMQGKKLVRAMDFLGGSSPHVDKSGDKS